MLVADCGAASALHVNQLLGNSHKVCVIVCVCVGGGGGGRGGGKFEEYKTNDSPFCGRGMQNKQQAFSMHLKI